MRFCTNCGKSLENDNFCTGCGTPAAIEATSPAPYQPLVYPPPEPAPQPPAPDTWAPVQSAATPWAPDPYATPVPQALQPGQLPQDRSPWTFGTSLAGLGLLIGIGACGFLLAYFVNPLLHKDNTLPPPLPQLASSDSQTYSQAPDAGTTEGKAFAELSRIAAQDRAALQASQQWRAQLSSSPANERATDVLRSYQDLMRTQPNSLLAWSGDWPGSYGRSSARSWVVLSQFTKPTTIPIINWCAEKHLGCWAKRMTQSGDPSDNTDHPPADADKN